MIWPRVRSTGPGLTTELHGAGAGDGVKAGTEDKAQVGVGAGTVAQAGIANYRRFRTQTSFGVSWKLVVVHEPVAIFTSALPSTKLYR